MVAEMVLFLPLSILGFQLCLSVCRMFTLLVPIVDFLPLILKKLGMPEVTYRESVDEVSKLSICTASVYFTKDGSHLRLFTATSPDGALGARHLAATVVVHHLKRAYQFVVVDANHRELAELKGLLIEPSPSHMTHVSSPLGDTLDLDTFAELWAAEGISFGLADASCQPKTTIGSGCSIVSTCEQNELPLPDVSQLYSVKHVLALPDPKKQTTNLVVDKEINKVDPRNMLIEGGKCFDELKVLRLKVEQLLRENTKLHAEALAYRVKRDHFRDSNARYLRITRTYCGNFDRIEAGDAIHDPDGTLALPAGYDGQIGGM